MEHYRAKSDEHPKHSQRKAPRASRHKRSIPAQVPGNHKDDQPDAGKRSRSNIGPPTAAGDENPPCNRSDGKEELLQIRARIMQLLAECDGLTRQISAAFGGQAFLPNRDPLDPVNLRRFYTLLHQHRKVSRLLGEGIELWYASLGVTNGIL
jgi:hypothetical protein